MSPDPTPEIIFDNTYVRDLEGFYVPFTGAKVPQPEVLRFNEGLAAELGLTSSFTDSPDVAKWLTGADMPVGAASIAMAYAGHQFGNFSPQLGDGRALLVGEVIDTNGRRRDLHLKGSGRTPFSRGGDGKAVLGPVLREYLLGEVMHAMGIPTTRALAASTTGESIYRHTGAEKGAVLARVASSHLRVGTFQFFAARGEVDGVRQLADYAIARHYPDIKDSDDKYLEFFRRVRNTQAELVSKWVLVGFVHGVMNTDNVTISGETIDYGPCAFIDNYDPNAVFSSIDEGARYAYGNQPAIAQWNLSRFAETLIALVNPDDKDDAVSQLTAEIKAFPEIYRGFWLKGMRAKLGLSPIEDDDLDLANDLHDAMDGAVVDFTKLFRALGGVVRTGDRSAVTSLFSANHDAINAWLDAYDARLAKEEAPRNLVAERMDDVNPIYIPRNHKVEEALAAANEDNMKPFDKLLDVLTNPFSEQSDASEFAEPAPTDFGTYKTFCGT